MRDAAPRAKCDRSDIKLSRRARCALLRMSTDVERLYVMSGAGAPRTCHQLGWPWVMTVRRLRGHAQAACRFGCVSARHHNGPWKLGPRDSTESLVKSFTSYI